MQSMNTVQRSLDREEGTSLAELAAESKVSARMNSGGMLVLLALLLVLIGGRYTDGIGIV